MTIEHPHNTPYEVVPEPPTLSDAETLLAEAACDMLDGPSTPAQRRAFLSHIAQYRGLLTAGAAELLEREMSEHGDETRARTSLIQFLFESKHNIVSTAAFAHSQSSKVEAIRHELEKTKTRRLLGKLTIGAAIGVAGYSAGEVAEQMSGNWGGGIAVAAWALNSGGRLLRPVFRALTGASGRKIRQKGYTGLEKTDVEVMRQILDSVAHIGDKRERDRIIYEKVTEIHLDPALAQLWKTLGPMNMADIAEREQVISTGVNTAITSLLGVYNLELEDMHKQPFSLRTLFVRVRQERASRGSL